MRVCVHVSECACAVWGDFTVHSPVQSVAQPAGQRDNGKHEHTRGKEDIADDEEEEVNGDGRRG